MSKRAVLITFLSVVSLVIVVGALSFYVAKNQPSADTLTPPTPPLPGDAPTTPPTPSDPGDPIYPPTPDLPLISGDATDDGIVDVLDVNVLLIHWNEENLDYSLVDEGETMIIDTLDLSQVIKYWRCLETRTDKNCPYRI